MNERPDLTAPHAESRTGQAVRTFGAPGFPFWTHLIAALAVPTLQIWNITRSYGIDTTSGWWLGVASPMWLWFGLPVLIVAMPPAVALEAWSVTHNRRGLARLAVLFYVLVAGYVSFFIAGFRFAGDTEPTPVDLITASLAVYGVIVGAQAICAFLACKLLARRAGRIPVRRA